MSLTPLATLAIIRKCTLGVILFAAFSLNVQSDELTIHTDKRSLDHGLHICDEFHQLLDASQPLGIERYALESAIPIGGNERDARYFNVDIDGDDVSDLVTVNCSASQIPADPCGLWIKLSSGKTIEFNADRFYLVRHYSNIYAVVNYIGVNKNVGKRRIYRVDRTGVKLVCQKL